MPVRLSRTSGTSQIWEIDPWWTLPSDKLDRFIHSPNCDLVAIEFGPDDSARSFKALKSLLDMDYITIMRDPVDMIFSRYNHLTRFGACPDPSVKDWMLNHPTANLMTCVLSASRSKPSLEQAKDTLLKFAAILFVESYKSDIVVMRKFGWHNLDIDANRSGTHNKSDASKSFHDDQLFLEQMHDKHNLDYQLIEYARSIQGTINGC